MADSQKRYYKTTDQGNRSIMAPGGNGIVMDNKNTYIMSENTTSDLEKLQQEGYNGTIPVNPNTVGSAIIVSKDGSYETELGNKNIDTLNQVDKQKPNDILVPDKNEAVSDGNALLIGDSQTPLIKSNVKSKNLKLNDNLWKVGWNVINLNSAVIGITPDTETKKIFICIGTNDGYQDHKKTPISTLVKNIKAKFPNAKLYVIKGSTGWGGVANITEVQVNNYYKLFEKENVEVLVQGIGSSKTHPTTTTPGIQKVALEIDNKLVTVLPTKESTPQPSPTPSPSKMAEQEEKDTDIYDADWSAMPIEEGTQLFDVIQVKENLQDNVPTIDSPSLVSKTSLESIKGVKNRNKGKIPKAGTDFEKYGSSFKLIQNDGTLGDQFYWPCALFNQGDNQWGSLSSGGLSMKGYGCCYNSFAMIATHKKNNAGYTTQWFWDNAKKSVVVYWTEMAGAIDTSGTLKSTTTTGDIDKLISTKPVMFEWDNVSKASKTSYSGKYTSRHHWMVIVGKNNDGTYTIFDPNGGKIWKKQSKEAIEAGLIRIFYLA